jgi:hypothetical protein
MVAQEIADFIRAYPNVINNLTHRSESVIAAAREQMAKLVSKSENDAPRAEFDKQLRKLHAQIWNTANTFAHTRGKGGEPNDKDVGKALVQIVKNWQSTPDNWMLSPIFAKIPKDLPEYLPLMPNSFAARTTLKKVNTDFRLVEAPKRNSTGHVVIDRRGNPVMVDKIAIRLEDAVGIASLSLTRTLAQIAPVKGMPKIRKSGLGIVATKIPTVREDLAILNELGNALTHLRKLMPVNQAHANWMIDQLRGKLIPSKADSQ